MLMDAINTLWSSIRGEQYAVFEADTSKIVFAFDTIEEKIADALDEYDLTIDRSKVNASGDSFYISFEDAEGESYTLRFSNHQQPARGSYRTSNARETSGIGGSRSVADVSVVLTDGAFDLTPALEFIERVGTGTDLDGLVRTGTDGAVGDDVRFLLSEYSEAQTSDIVAVLRPYVGYYLAKEDADYQAHLKSLGIEVDVHDAHAFAVLAMRENQSDQAARSAEKRKKTLAARNKARSEYLYNSIPLYREAVDFAGTEDFKIKPSARFRGEEFSGSFISPEFVKFSKSKKKDPSKLDAASGINSDEFAESLARSWGRDALEVEQEIIDFFRDLKKRDLYKEYSDFRNESLLADKEEDRIAREEFEASERARTMPQKVFFTSSITDFYYAQGIQKKPAAFWTAGFFSVKKLLPVRQAASSEADSACGLLP